jgi:transcriptional regulator with XRE-family HTH domain
MSQAELAEAIGVTEETVGNWEASRSLPREAMLERLELEFELQPGELVKLRAAQERQRLYSARRRARDGRRVNR